MTAPGAQVIESGPVDLPLDVLLVEDDDGDAILFETVLGETAVSARVERARSLAEARALLDEPTGCVVLDLGLPDSHGLDGLRALRVHAPDTPIVVLTGHADDAQGLEALSAGAQDYLTKGTIDGASLRRTLRYAIERLEFQRTRIALREAELSALENARLERGLLPTPLLADARLRVEHGYRPGRERGLVGGDFFDAIERPDGSLHLLIGDVCGRSADEAALGVNLRIAWRSLMLADASSDRALQTLDMLLVHERHSQDLFTTVATMAIDADRRTADLRLAGHPAPILLADGGGRLLEGERGLPLGLGDTAWPQNVVSLPDEWGLVLYTDGLIEGRVPDGDPDDRLGDERLAEITARHRWRENGFPDAVISEVEELNGGAVRDDMALLMVAFTP